MGIGCKMESLVHPSPIPGDSVPILTSDPTSPNIGDLWVLKISVLGTPIGLLLSLTRNTNLYQLVEFVGDGNFLRTEFIG